LVLRSGEVRADEKLRGSELDKRRLFSRSVQREKRRGELERI